MASGKAENLHFDGAVDVTILIVSNDRSSTVVFAKVSYWEVNLNHTKKMQKKSPNCSMICLTRVL